MGSSDSLAGLLEELFGTGLAGATAAALMTNKIIDTVIASKGTRISSIDNLTYERLIELILENRPHYPNNVKAVILRHAVDLRKEEMYEILAVYLDNGDNIVLYPNDGKPYVFRIRARELNEELEKTFGRKSFFVVE